MAITLNGLSLPDGLRWSDEFTWTPLQTVSNHSVTGALLLQTSARLAGRPITLIGGETWAWMSRAHLISLKTLLDTYADSMTLVLHDGRSFSVVPVYENDGPLDAVPKSVVLDSGYASPGPGAWYVINSLKLITV